MTDKFEERETRLARVEMLKEHQAQVLEQIRILRKDVRAAYRELAIDAGGDFQHIRLRVIKTQMQKSLKQLDAARKEFEFLLEWINKGPFLLKQDIEDLVDKMTRLDPETQKSALGDAIGL